MGIASGSTPTCSPSTNSSSSDEPEFTFPPAIARSMSYRSASRIRRNSAQAQYPFPPVVEGALHRTSSQATVVYGEQPYAPAAVNRTSSLATIRQSMAYLQSFDEPTYPPPVGNNWASSLATITAAPMQTAATQTDATQTSTVYSGNEQAQQSTTTFRGLSLATITPITIKTGVREPSIEGSPNPSLSRESSQSIRTESTQSATTPGSIYSIPELQPVRPTLNRAPSQTTIPPVSIHSLSEPQTPPLPVTRTESQKTITPASYYSSIDNSNLPPISPSLPSSTPDEPHPHHPHFPHNVHHHHHRAKTSLHGTTDSTCSWSTNSNEPDPRYDRLLFDYRVVAQSMHAYRQISIFRRFGRLSMANLLYYQDELAGIERALAHVDREETRWMQTGVSESEVEKHELRETRVKLMKMLRETLKNYCTFHILP